MSIQIIILHKPGSSVQEFNEKHISMPPEHTGLMSSITTMPSDNFTDQI